MTNCKQTLERGIFFDKKEWDRQPCSAWEHVKNLIPKPIYDADPAAIKAYYHSWKMAVDVLQEPLAGSGFVSNYMFFDFNGADAVFAHDSALMTMFGRYAFRAFNAIETLDNFYARQHSNGEICREINRITGEDYWVNKDGDPMTIHLEDPWGEHGGDWSKVKSYKWNRPTITTAPPANCSIDGLTDHKFLWAELLNYRLTGNKKRLEQVITPLEKWYSASRTYLRDSNGLYITDWAGMDNSPRNREMKYGVDISSQMVYRASYIAEIYRILGLPEKAEPFENEASELAEIIREKMWNPETGFFHDLTSDEKFVSARTIAGFWPVFAKVADKAQLESLKKHLRNPQLFKSEVMVPSLARNEEKYCEWGEYYFGGVWPYTNAMIIEGFEKYGETQLATEIARNYWKAAVQIHKDTGTVWEYFAPDHIAPGRSTNPDNPGANARKDFAGWGAYPLITPFLEYGIGLKADAEKNILTWNLNETCRCGCANFAFGNIVTDLISEPRNSLSEKPNITVKTNRPYTLKLIWGENQGNSIIRATA
jgi:mannosylglycerate hydrolase MGH1-like protein